MGISSSKTTQKSTPWAPAEPYIKDSLGALQSGYGASNASVMQNMPAIQSAIGSITNRMANPPAYATDARTQLDKTINGDYVNSNPWTGQMADQIAQRTGAQYDSTFGAAGRAHGGLSALLSSQGVGDALSNFYGNQYNTERGQQQQAIGMAPAFNADEYAGVSPLLAASQTAAQLPMMPAGAYASGIAGATSPYGTRTETQTQPWGPAALGAALSVASAAFGAPGAGAGLSGLLSGGASKGLSGMGIGFNDPFNSFAGAGFNGLNMAGLLGRGA